VWEIIKANLKKFKNLLGLVCKDELNKEQLRNASAA